MALTSIFFAQSISSKKFCTSGVYEQTFYLYEYTDGDNGQLLVFVSDNGTKKLTYYSSIPTVYYVWSKWFSRPCEYTEAMELTKKNFFDVTMNLVSLAETKDICDIAP